MLIVHLVDALFATVAEHPLISAALQAELGPQFKRALVGYPARFSGFCWV
ncbi:hypothetical protein [Synechococcus sp. NOUM97013]|nr:hypothetical protein [Synechococcus sp. NOUM97013]QNI73614.1 hypothetical protein SynNOUM97013_01555 [Synechococcus sp. NOUM97013]